jgi:signal transduction histidine kinase
VVTLALVVATTLLHFGLPRFAGHLGDPEARVLVGAATVAMLLLVLVPGRAALEMLVRGVTFRRGRRCRAALQRFLHTLAPELGARECCRRALAEVVRVMDLRGAAILLDRDARAIACEGLAPEALEGVWPRGPEADRLPRLPFEFYSIQDAPLRKALSDTGVALVVPITSPRAAWGHLFVAEGVLSHVTQEEQHVETLATFAAQLALVLDATDLHARAVAVERSLAHAEKLAAIGELSARIVHEIRNPVTAARSLAQQLAQEPGVAFGAELGVILAELERVERQVADLLRFARQDRLQPEPTDLAALVRATLARFAPRFAQAGIATDVALAEGVTAVVDREKIHQVLVNVIENAIDALAADGADRRLHVTLAVDGRVAHLCVSDNGPGVDADAVARLFEPFFSLKAHGTGLGLAIAKRTIDAHGGRIHAERGGNAGMTMHVELPLETR